ncbi:alpha-glucan family phosphorylase [Gorillibacterium timonense]|uniref:alpha-glucan family phosphorylase n=1 Tax=Gorillibacterium timonense TaxID=1689269 RepID=UPI00071C3335|nr:alpha-glucan family phosphorylase [Gorillibacterium timonense]
MAQDLRIPERFASLSELAGNLWFSWNDGATRLFRHMAPVLWEQLSHNPVLLLKQLTEEDWQRLAQDEEFAGLYEEVTATWTSYQAANAWFQKEYPGYRSDSIAYFSAEFGFHESLPIYSGGLGVLAGDHLKSASDLGLPLTGIGLLYRKGYFRQKLDSSGIQTAERVDHDFADHPVRPVQGADGGELFVDVLIEHDLVKLKIWATQIGRVTLYLLDSDLEDNSPVNRELTSQLYGGGQDMRIAQELILGVGGVRALRALRLAPAAYHINEGHAAFLSLERIREYLAAGFPYETALELVRASTIFTTHTPVPAGHDTFPLDLFHRNLDGYLPVFGSARESVINLGFDPDKNQFNMTFLAMNCAALRNGVSKLHGHVSRMMFKGFLGGFEVDEVPIGHVTNGVHMESWTAPEIAELYDRHLPADWRTDQADASLWLGVSSIPDEELWDRHHKLKKKLVDTARANLEEQRRRNGESPERISEAGTLLNPEALTIGFARRFATYKRANLLFKDLPRLSQILNHPTRPVQFLFAGKAHPADIPGQDLIREIYRVSQLNEFRGKVVMLENYDIGLARELVQGVDIWLNNPLRPLEASGTSGEKAAMNGVLNFSVLDGWWEEGYDGANGWSIESDPHSDWQAQEQQNADSLYSRLENEIIPLYYADADADCPHTWISRMKHSIQTLAHEYNTNRMVQDYTREFYVPTMERFCRFTANDHAEAEALARFKKLVNDHWPEVSVTLVEDKPEESAPAGLKEVDVEIGLGLLPADSVAAEIVYYADNSEGIWEPVHVPLERKEELGGGKVRFRGQIPVHLHHLEHYSVRVRPDHPLFAHRFEMPLGFTTVH